MAEITLISNADTADIALYDKVNAMVLTVMRRFAGTTAPTGLGVADIGSQFFNTTNNKSYELVSNGADGVMWREAEVALTVEYM